MVPVEELIQLFTGETSDDGCVLTEPYPTLPLALAICNVCRPANLAVLLDVVFAKAPAEEIPWRQSHTLAIGFGRYERQRRKQLLAAGKGL